MAHELEEFDSVVLFKNAAWHGLGTVVEDAPTPREARKLARMEWEVEQWPITAIGPNGQTITLDSHVANVRTDCNVHLGIVGKDWTPFQTSEMADFCEALAEAGDKVVCESAGSIRNGAKCWFLLRGESFTVRSADVLCPYLLVSNGFDGATALRCTPTFIRVVCSNTLHAVIPQSEAVGRRLNVREAGYAVHHTGNLLDRVQEAKAALRMYSHALDVNREMIDRLAAREMDSEAVKRFLLECYVRDFGAIADVPVTSREIGGRKRAIACVSKCLVTFDKEMDLAGPTAWNAMNSYTNWLQHGRTIRGMATQANTEARIGSRLFGTDAGRATATYELALAV